MSKKISLTNFQKVSPDVTQYSDKNQHYMMSGVDPLYSASQNTIQEEQVAPLAASYKMKLAMTDTGTAVIITDIIPASFANGGAQTGVWAIDDGNYVFDGTNVYSPWTGSTGQTNFLTQFGNFVIASSSNSQKLAYQSGSYGGFTLMTMTGLNFGSGPVYMTPFLEFCMACYLGKVYKITIGSVPDIVLNTPAIDIGTNFAIIAKPVIYNNYASIPARYGGDYNGNYLFLWNGTGISWQYKVPLPGKFIGQSVIKGTLYVVVENKSGVQNLYYLVNYQLRKVKGLHGLYTTITNKPHPVLNIGDFVGILTDNGVFKWTKDEILGEVSYLYNTGNYNCGCTGGANNYLYTTTGLQIFNDTIIANTFNNISYISEWIPVKNVSGIDIIYDIPPQISGDAINVTLYGKGEDIITGNSTQVLNSITPSTILNTTRTRVDVQGFTGDKAKLLITTTASAVTTWQPIIRQIDVIVV